MRRSYLILIFVLFFFLYTSPVFAESSYVLPYPSSMPGSSLYKVHILYENISKYWYFGDFGQFKYDLRYADKYLVEAKTLFEYKQYLLAYSALEKSNYYFSKISGDLKKAQGSNKNITEKENIFQEASGKHIETLESLKTEVPAKFVWIPEKGNPSNLNIHKLIDDSIKIRESVL